MLVRGSDVIGLKVISVKQGKKIKDIDDIIYDPKRNKVLAFLVDEGGWFSDAEVIPIEDVKTIGNDAVLVESEDALKKASDIGERASHIANDDTHLTKTKVVTEEGNELGKVTDILFDSRNGEVKELEVSEGGLKTLQSGKKRVRVQDIVTIGEDATIVKSYTEEKFAKQSQEKVGKVQNNLDYYWQDAKRQFEKLSSILQTKSEQFRHDPKNKQRLAETKDEVKRAKNELEKAFNEVKESIGLKIDETKEKSKAQLKNDAAGRYLTKTILSPKDKVLGKRGEMVTHKLLNEAEKEGILDQVIRNLSHEPIK